ncbi:MAG: PEGA domain-containing protein [Prolixibacteraceae bacterium]|jgi:hypothetical protein|nr:PEGA domain-containing protein [Prolixibacteraceae bacterium]
MNKSTCSLKLLSIFFALLIAVTSCSSTTYIESTPTGADLYLDGESVGQTPYAMTDTKPMFSCTTLRMEKEGYQTLYNSICRDEEADVGAIIGGFFFWVPFIWSMKYKPHHHYKLRQLDDAKPKKQDNKNKYDGFEMLIEGDEE